MQCRLGCGACCIAPSISTPMQGLPAGKPAGQRCLHLDDDYRCGLWGSSERPRVCKEFKPEIGICGQDRNEAMQILTLLEQTT